MKGKTNFRDLSEAELGQKARELREEVFNLRFQVSMAMAKNPARIGAGPARAGPCPDALARARARAAARLDAGRRGVLKTRVGLVVSDKMSKTRVVVVERAFRHPRYERVVKRTRRFKAHDEKNEAHVGDRVLIVETRPLSKDKRWRIKEILERAS